MPNDNKKTKNNAPCEEKQDMRELTPDELANVTGGFALTSKLDVAPGLAEMEVIAKRVSAPLIK